MDVIITKPCDVRIDGTVRALAVGTEMNLPDEKARKLVNAGYADFATFEDGHWRQDIGNLVTDFGQQDPRGKMVRWIKTNRPELWSAYSVAMRDIDNGYAARDAGRVMAAKVAALRTFRTMTEAWEQGVQ